MGWLWSPSGWLDKLHGWMIAAPTSFFAKLQSENVWENPLSLPSFGLINTNVYHKYHNFSILETPSVSAIGPASAVATVPLVPLQVSQISCHASSRYCGDCEIKDTQLLRGRKNWPRSQVVWWNVWWNVGETPRIFWVKGSENLNPKLLCDKSRIWWI